MDCTNNEKAILQMAVAIQSLTPAGTLARAAKSSALREGMQRLNGDKAYVFT
jgi:hypothetical protein